MKYASKKQLDRTKGSIMMARNKKTKKETFKIPEAKAIQISNFEDAYPENFKLLESGAAITELDLSTDEAMVSFLAYALQA